MLGRGGGVPSGNDSGGPHVTSVCVEVEGASSLAHSSLVNR